MTAGTHTVRVSEWFSDGTVDYTISLERISAPPSPSAAVPILFSETLSGEIDPLGDVDLFRFEASAGAVIKIAASRNDGGTQCIELFGPDGVQIGTASCNNGAQLSPPMLMATGTHTIAVSEWFSDGTVAYTLDIQCISPEPCTQPSPFRTKVGVFRNGAWYLDNSKDGNVAWDGCGASADTDHCGGFGIPGDLPVVGDWDGSGKTKIGVFRNGRWFLDNGNGKFDGCGSFPALDRCGGSFGLAGDLPVVGDWDGSGKSKVGVFRNGGWFLDNGNLQWDGCGQFPGMDRCGGFGLAGDIPMVGRWSVFP
jgi:hypothetical protein